MPETAVPETAVPETAVPETDRGLSMRPGQRDAFTRLPVDPTYHRSVAVLRFMGGIDEPP